VPHFSNSLLHLLQSVRRALRLLQQHDARIGPVHPDRVAMNEHMELLMRQAFQGAALVVAVGVQMLTFYSVLYA
jgi:hypothetical protein